MKIINLHGSGWTILDNNISIRYARVNEHVERVAILRECLGYSHMRDVIQALHDLFHLRKPNPIHTWRPNHYPQQRENMCLRKIKSNL